MESYKEEFLVARIQISIVIGLVGRILYTWSDRIITVEMERRKKKKSREKSLRGNIEKVLRRRRISEVNGVG